MALLAIAICACEAHARPAVAPAVSAEGKGKKLFPPFAPSPPPPKPTEPALLPSTDEPAGTSILFISRRLSWSGVYLEMVAATTCCTTSLCSAGVSVALSTRAIEKQL